MIHFNMKDSKISRLVLGWFFVCNLCLSAVGQHQPSPETEEVSPTNALAHYIHMEDDAYQWELKESAVSGKSTIYQLLLTSQVWRDHLWRHQLTVIVPREIDHDGAMLFISGGSNKDEQPNWNTQDRMWPALANVAEKNRAIISILKQTPNQPLYGGKTEDKLISYTFHNFQNDKDYTWPLLFPMVKSALKAMDAIQEFAAQQLNHQVNRFIVSGASKRGWTTWLAAATGDPRIKAIAPMVIDVLNMPVNLQYQVDSYGAYSEQIQDYVNLGIVQSIATEEGKALTTMIDPYSYRPLLTAPKMIFIGTNDEYWTVDAVKHYYYDLPGKKMIHYVPNVGHDLGGGKQALAALSAFFGTTLTGENYPTLSWETEKAEGTTLFTFSLEDPNIVKAEMWAASSVDRDFRDEKWKSSNLGKADSKKIMLEESHPQAGYKAFYIDVTYRAPYGGTYTVSSRIFLLGEEGLL